MCLCVGLCVCVCALPQSLLSIGAILVLLVAMSSERFLFKVMVDRMESYRCVGASVRCCCCCFCC